MIPPSSSFRKEVQTQAVLSLENIYRILIIEEGKKEVNRALPVFPDKKGCSLEPLGAIRVGFSPPERITEGVLWHRGFSVL
jgi:hypothetical protein